MTGDVTPDPHQVWDELVVGQALGALEPEDEHALRVHLSACARCERELRRHESTLTHLAYAPEHPAPPPALLDAIRAAVAAEGGAVTPALDLSSLEPGRVVVPLAPRRQRRGVQVVGLAAAVALVLGLSGWNLALQREAAQAEQVTARVQAAIDTLEDGRTVPLLQPDATVAAVAVLHEGAVSVVADGLAPNNVETSTYVLWGSSRGALLPLGTFDVHAHGADVAAVRLALPASAGVERFMITHEGGRTAPDAPRADVLATGVVPA